jgi:hypothetical protein
LGLYVLRVLRQVLGPVSNHQISGNPAGSIREPRGFASHPHGRFAFDTLGSGTPGIGSTTVHLKSG